MRALVLGGGGMGSACALDLARRGAVEHVVLADLESTRPREFLAPFLGSKIEVRRIDARNPDQVRSALRHVDAVACALPYYFNLDVARLAVEAGVHFCDLGGNTEIVEEQKVLHEQAVAAGVSVVPDCGLAPGMVNILARGGIDALDRTASVRIYVGGLPQHADPPLNYQLVYSMEGVLDYYTTPVLVLEGADVVEKEALTEVESVDFPAPVGRLEAFLTAGGISRMPYLYEGLIPTMEYKTLRYPGHAYLMRSMRDLGLLDVEPIEVDGCEVSPRDVFIAAVTPRLLHPEGGDLVAMRIVVAGTRAGAERTISYEMLDFQDTELGVTAMMRTTGYSLAAVARMQATGAVKPGVWTAGACVPVDDYVASLAECGVRIDRTES